MLSDVFIYALIDKIRGNITELKVIQKLLLRLLDIDWNPFLLNKMFRFRKVSICSAFRSHFVYEYMIRQTMVEIYSEHYFHWNWGNVLWIFVINSTLIWRLRSYCRSICWWKAFLAVQWLLENRLRQKTKIKYFCLKRMRSWQLIWLLYKTFIYWKDWVLVTAYLCLPNRSLSLIPLKSETNSIFAKRDDKSRGLKIITVSV